jgi:hypothetical protein
MTLAGSVAGPSPSPRARPASDATADPLVFTGPGGGWYAPRGSRTALTRGNFERVYHRAIARLTDPAAAPLRPTAARLAKALRTAGPGTLAELTARLAVTGRAVSSISVRIGLGELAAAGLAAADHDPDDPIAFWSAATPQRNPVLDELDLHGPHDFRHTLATGTRSPQAVAVRDRPTPTAIPGPRRQR